MIRFSKNTSYTLRNGQGAVCIYHNSYTDKTIKAKLKLDNGQTKYYTEDGACYDHDGDELDIVS